MVLDDALDADPTAAVDDGLGALQQLRPTLCTALVPVLTILWNISGDISKLSGISFKGDLMVFGPSAERSGRVALHASGLEQRYPCSETRRPRGTGPDAGLDLADMRSAQEQHAEPRLSDAAADG